MSITLNELGRYQEVREMEKTKMRPCPDCDGRGKVEYSYEIDLLDDQGSNQVLKGLTDCESCGGKGKLEVMPCICGKDVFVRASSKWLIHLKTGNPHCYTDGNKQTAKVRETL